MEEQHTIAGLLRGQAARQPDATMLVDGQQRLTWGEQQLRSSRLARALRSEGVAPGDRVAFIDRNSAAFFDVVFGAAMAGAVTVPVSWRLAQGELAAILADARPPVLVAHADQLRELAAGEGGLAGLADLVGLRRVVVLGADPGEAFGPDSVSLEDWLAAEPPDDPGHRAAPGEVAVQLYTSGTTGLPKGAMLTNANLAFAMDHADQRFGIDGDTVSLVAMPLFHIGGAGWALCAMARGGRSVILREVDPKVLLELVARERVTHTFVVPAVLMMMLATPGVEAVDFSSFRTIFYGASPISEDLLVRCLQTFGCDFVQLYGMTETTGAICALPAADHDPGGPRHHLLRAAGLPYPEVELRVVDPDTGVDVATGSVGEVWTRSALNMAGYWQKPEETAATITADGWLRTGDAGYLDDEGYLFLHDRIKDMVVTGGENVYPAEVENVLLSHEGVSDAAVIGVPDERWGETVKALVVRVPGAAGRTVTPDELITHCRARLAHFKCPTSVEFLDELPRNATGKVLKRELRARYWSTADRGIH